MVTSPPPTTAPFTWNLDRKAEYKVVADCLSSCDVNKKKRVLGTIKIHFEEEKIM